MDFGVPNFVEDENTTKIRIAPMENVARPMTETRLLETIRISFPRLTAEGQTRILAAVTELYTR